MAQRDPTESGAGGPRHARDHRRVVRRVGHGPGVDAAGGVLRVAAGRQPAAALPTAAARRCGRRGRRGARRRAQRAGHPAAGSGDGRVRARGGAGAGGGGPAAERAAVDAERGVPGRPARPVAGAGQDPAAARGLGVAERDDRLQRRLVRRGLPGRRPEQGPEAARGDPGRRLRQGDKCGAGGAPVRGRARRADRRRAAAGPAARGQQLPDAAAGRRSLRDRGAPAGRPRRGQLPDHQRRAPARAALEPGLGRVGDRQRTRYGARRAAASPSCTSARAGCCPARR